MKATRKARREGLDEDGLANLLVDELIGKEVGGNPTPVKLDPKVETFFLEKSYSYLRSQYDDPKPITLDERHLTFIRTCRMGFNGAEVGSPCIDNDEPYGPDPLQALGTLFGEQAPLEQAKIYVEMTRVIEEFFRVVKIEPGLYRIDRDEFRRIQRHMSGFPGINDTSDIGLTKDGQVQLEQDNIDLLRQTPWDFETNPLEYEASWPGPGIDCKRPYGAMSYFALDIAQILDWPTTKNDEGMNELSDEQDDRAQSIHFKCLASVIAIMKHGQIEGS